MMWTTIIFCVVAVLAICDFVPLPSRLQVRNSPDSLTQSLLMILTRQEMPAGDTS